ncbi:LysR family transcriptional regulator [Pseudomonas asiatica]|uniref:LysR family transcriptional regulator n=1 Tax=Pseudomonas monteilii TaxID=76759 RepID=A0A2N1IN66_9PSED|nr:MULTISPECIES: LysR family transcriptional regulator [Pseudomonas]PKI19695.1 LysR family transcriptional regulator [Pseudomonas monteilii]RPD93993.1 LysR family transcriptional regulator [Pseudomonas monteilii]WDM87331.1 LysR family transcriptional regulator [Pseudomonas asiatica]
MNTPQLHWETQRVFLAVLRTGSLSAASRALGVAQATARRRIDELEHSVGVSLFVRSPKGLMPTDTARELAGHAESMALAAEAFTRAASAESSMPRGTVRVTSSRLMSVEVLPLLLRDVRNAQPELKLELSVCNRQENLAMQEADVAVRIHRPTESTVVTRHVGDLRLGLYATEELVALNGTPRHESELDKYPLIGPDRNLSEIAFLGQQGYLCTADRTAIRTDDHLAQFSALRAGLGIGMCSSQLAKRHGLVRVLPKRVDFKVGVWIAMHHDLRRVKRIALVFDTLGRSLSRFLEASE